MNKAINCQQYLIEYYTNLPTLYKFHSSNTTSKNDTPSAAIIRENIAVNIFIFKFFDCFKMAEIYRKIINSVVT